jgi:hypothetical protein
MKKILSILIIFILIISLSDCNNDEKNKLKKLFSKAKVGDVVKFGSYEQDDNLKNGKEDIEWIVLDKKYNKALLLSKYALDSMPYNEHSNKNMTWENCTLRNWLNDTFLEEAFNHEEYEIIYTANISADKNPNYDADPGKNTKDKVFLLSIKEVKKYFPSKRDRECQATEYAKAEGILLSDATSSNGEENCLWLLRTPGNTNFFVSFVNPGGYVYDFGDFPFFNEHYGVRPAIWVKFSLINL